MKNERLTITKEWLQTLGITNVTEEGVIYLKGNILKQKIATCKHKHGTDRKYPVVVVYDPELYQEQLKTKSKNKSGQRRFLVSRVVYAWFNEVCPNDYDVDHIDNNPFNSSINNLQLLTRKENLARRLARNQHNCNWSEEELKYYKEQSRKYQSMIDYNRTLVKEKKEEIKELKKYYHHLLDICKTNKKFRGLKEEKARYKIELAEAEADVKSLRDEWHNWCALFSEFKKNFKSQVEK